MSEIVIIKCMPAPELTASVAPCSDFQGTATTPVNHTIQIDQPVDYDLMGSLFSYTFSGSIALFCIGIICKKIIDAINLA